MDTQAQLSPEVMEAAKAQAAKDQALLEALKAKRDEARATMKKDLEEQEELEVIETDEGPVAMARVPMNRAARRQQVKLYAMLLAKSERQTPIVNPTVIPKSKRRRRSHRKGNLQHANA